MVPVEIGGEALEQDVAVLSGDGRKLLQLPGLSGCQLQPSGSTEMRSCFASKENRPMKRWQEVKASSRCSFAPRSSVIIP
jgi:hypothetical protein